MALPDDVLSGEAVVVEPAPADDEIPEVSVQHGDGCGCVLDKQGQHGAAGAKGLFGPFQSRNILNHSDRPHRNPVVAEHLDRSVRHPADGSVPRDESFFAGPGIKLTGPRAPHGFNRR